MITDRFTTAQVVHITGFSMRQLDYWASKGIVRPGFQESHGPGTRRLYNFEDLVRLHFVQKLHDAGWSTQKARKALEQLNKVTAEGSGFKYVSLIIDKHTVLALCETEEKQQVLLDILNPGGQQVLWIVLETLRSETRKNANRVLRLFETDGESTAFAV